MQDLRISTAVEDQDIALIHRWLSERSTWAIGIPLETVRTSIAHSLNFGGFVGASQVAFARVVTDHATFAYLADVFVLEEHRGRGYGFAVVSAAMAHPALRGLRRFLLATSHAHALYGRFGFTAPAKPQALMERFDPDAYRPRRAVDPAR